MLYNQIEEINHMRKMLPSILLGILIITVFSCKENDPEPITEPTENEIVIDWIWDVLTDIYYWAEEVDRNLYPTEESDPVLFFESLLNEDDRFSWIEDDYQGLLDRLDNISLSNGVSPYFIRLRDSDGVIAVVEYVAHDSPADSAGIRRGEIITHINGTAMNINNYANLFYNNDVTLEFADYSDGLLTPNGKEVALTAQLIDENPIQHHQVIEYEGTDIGYIAYTGFTGGENDKYMDSLDLIFADFKSRGIQELILDIRYNPGGYAYVANHIASMMCPADVTNNENVFYLNEWNDAYQQYFMQEFGEDSEYLSTFFEEDPTYNLGLSDAYFLTGWHSASASELIIIGLQPYMNVTQIGENTYGKFYGSITIPDMEEPPRHNWAMQPLVFKYTSATGYTGTAEGLEPDIYIEDNLMDMKPFGDITDPTLAAALEQITGVSPVAKKAIYRPVEMTLLPDPVRATKMLMTERLNGIDLGKRN